VSRRVKWRLSKWKNGEFKVYIGGDMKNYLIRVEIGLVSQEPHEAIF